MTEELHDELVQWMSALGFYNLRILPTGKIAANHKFLFTVAVAIGLDVDGSYRTRWCYQSAQEAENALKDWDGLGDPPGNWIKQKPEGRYNPALFEHVGGNHWIRMAKTS